MEIRDSLFGAVVVKLGLCSASDVEEALALQEKYRDNWRKVPRLGEALAALGKLSPEHVRAVLAGELNQKPGRRFGEILVGLKLVGGDAVKEMLKRQKDDPRPIGRLMVEAGLIREEHVSVVLAAQGLSPRYCAACNTVYNVPAGMRNDFYICPECRSALGECPLEVETVKAPEVVPVEGGRAVEGEAVGTPEDLPEVPENFPPGQEEELPDFTGMPVSVPEPPPEADGAAGAPVSPLSPAEGVEEAPPILSEGVARGDVYGPFSVVEAIGEDAHSILYRAQDTRDGSTVALRLFPDPVLNTPEQLKIMEAARTKLASVSHPGFKRILEVGEEGGLNYIAEEFITGKSLRSFLEGGEKIHLRTATSLILQVAEVFAEAHDAGVHHLGLRPSLIIVRPNGKIKVGGFGYPKDALSDMRRMAERTGEVLVYAAPELAVEGLPRDHRADIYSLGAVYYHLIAGRPPFRGESVGELLLRMSAEDAPPVASFRNDIPERVNDLVARMLAVEPSERPQSMREVMDLLRDVADLESGMEPAVLSFPEGEAQPEGIAPGARRSRRVRKNSRKRPRSARMRGASSGKAGAGRPAGPSRKTKRSPVRKGMSPAAKGLLIIGGLAAAILAAIGAVLMVVYK